MRAAKRKLGIHEAEPVLRTVGFDFGESGFERFHLISRDWSPPLPKGPSGAGIRRTVNSFPRASG